MSRFHCTKGKVLHMNSNKTSYIILAYHRHRLRASKQKEFLYTMNITKRYLFNYEWKW